MEGADVGPLDGGLTVPDTADGAAADDEVATLAAGVAFPEQAVAASPSMTSTGIGFIVASE